MIDFPTSDALRKLINSWQPQPASQAEPTALPLWPLEREQDYARSYQAIKDSLMPSWDAVLDAQREAYRSLLLGELSLTLVTVGPDGVELRARQVRG